MIWPADKIMKTHLVVSAAFATVLAYASSASPEKQSTLMSIRKVYVTGLNFGQVEWAYKNFADHKASCVTPVSTPEEADAILTIEPRYSSDVKRDSGPYWVNCTSSRSSTTCIDSTGFESTTSCECGNNGRDSASRKRHVCGGVPLFQGRQVATVESGRIDGRSWLGVRFEQARRLRPAKMSGHTL
jgi:hypothetical protein